MSKKYCIFLTVLFCAVHRRDFGGQPPGRLTGILPSGKPLSGKAPQAEPGAWKDGTFMEDAEDYVSDHIVGRDFWVALKAWSERLSGKQENNGVYFGKEDTLINRLDDPDLDDADDQCWAMSTPW